jgi:ABC-2 type transport system permease protein
MQHRASFFMLSTAHFLSTFVVIFGIWVLFARFDSVLGWTFAEVALIYAVINMGFALAEAFGRGFDTFDQMVRLGEFDRVLLRPLGTFFQIATREVQVMRVGRFLQGIVVLGIAANELNISLFSFSSAVICIATAGTAALFYGLFVLQATIAFWTTETLELMNIATYGGVEAGQFPITIYPKSFQLILIFVVPLACVTYYPIAILLGHVNFPLFTALFFPLAGFLFLFISCLLWHIGVKHYSSTGN